ncbi:hypothetical protein CRG98_034109 [Punica granatum]|uniref:WD repeat-containing protein 44 n=1 Tax=Punica granatum TaxID=22663 RepID=A0A2I0INC3_PUNGR|nr:hypothetical protein CRG98_034109 [Punica granatum]
MGEYCGQDGDERFFDAREETSSVSDWSIDSSDGCSSSPRVVDDILEVLRHEIWTKCPESVRERRNRFLNWTGLNYDWSLIEREESWPSFQDEIEVDKGRIAADSGAILRDFDYSFSCIHSSRSNWALESTCYDSRDGSFGARCKDSDDGVEVVVGEFMRKVRTHSRKKKYKELSSLYAGQEFLAHEGSISAMKFSVDGRYLASSGEDAVVRVWRVIEEERLERIDVSDLDSSCLYFAINESSELASLNVDKEHYLGRAKRIGRQSESCCVVLPSKVFHILEKPLHEFYGHLGEVLDLTWSKKGYLLSSSVDKTVRLWQVGTDRCLRVFSHNNYVTSINFNPVDENFFISGSIDGKVRIWEVLSGKVVDYISMREIVSAVSYQSDGKGAIVGTMNGNCCFYSIEDNHLHLDAQICVHSGKKSPGKRITGFQFTPSDPSKVMVTSADSTVRILSGLDVICKFRGSSGCHSIASFTSDGKHVISANEDSSVCIWNYTNQEKTRSRAKSVLSCESFFSDNVSIAIPWCGPMHSMQREDGQIESGPTIAVVALAMSSCSSARGPVAPPVPLIAFLELVQEAALSIFSAPGFDPKCYVNLSLKSDLPAAERSFGKLQASATTQDLETFIRSYFEDAGGDLLYFCIHVALLFVVIVRSH